ncbi:MAG: VWA domain-containing protein, partial [Planctomycetota bacterium]
MIPFELTRPWIIVAMLPAAAVVAYYFRFSLSDFPRRQRLVSMWTRMLLLLMLVLALAGLTLLHRTDERFVIVLSDQSQSVGEQGIEKTRTLLRDALRQKGNHRVAVLEFAADPGTVRELTADGLASVEPDASDVDTEAGPDVPIATPVDPEDSAKSGTNLGAAIQAASGFVPPGYVSEIVLLSDGNETTGDALAAAAQSSIAVTTIPLPTLSDPEVQVAEVRVPAEVRQGEPFFVNVSIQSNHEDEGLVEVFRGDHKVISEIQSFAVGENEFRFQQSIENDRLAAFTVRISGLKQDSLLDNNSDAGLVYASGKPRVLIIESDPNLIRELAYALEDEGVQVDVRPPQGMPDSLADFQNYECLMLSNVPATDLTQQQMQTARTWVQELGGGFIMLGGEQSFGLGGYYKSSLEEILPVRSDFEKEKEKPSLGMVLVIDKSGSMDGERIEMAKSAARSAVELLGKRDQAAVIAFDGQPYVISEMQSARNAVKLSDEISRIEAGGGTNMYPAMEMSFEMLMATSAKLKHVILLTDGISSGGDFEGMAQQMSSSKITVSTVAVGDGADTDLLEQIARVGKGRYYFTTDPAQVPQIFAKETVTASKSAIDEQPFIPQVIRATHALADLD